jgi:hypothetical protein
VQAIKLRLKPGIIQLLMGAEGNQDYEAALSEIQAQMKSQSRVNRLPFFASEQSFSKELIDSVTLAAAKQATLPLVDVDFSPRRNEDEIVVTINLISHRGK